MLIKDNRWSFFLPKNEGAVNRFGFVYFYSPFLITFFKEGEIFLDIRGKGDSDWVIIVGYYCFIIGKITNKRNGQCGLVGYENIE